MNSLREFLIHKSTSSSKALSTAIPFHDISPSIGSHALGTKRQIRLQFADLLSESLAFEIELSLLTEPMIA